MGWVHCYKRFGACLALAALALQMVVSFGHVHLDRAARSSAAIAAAASHGTALAQASPRSPAQNPSDDDDYCAICASIFLASTSFIALPPPLPVPLGFTRIAHSYGAAFGVIAPRRGAFQSRAPPAA
jgi:hypothetical protein